jgi:gliding motility-associated-like protein
MRSLLLAILSVLPFLSQAQNNTFYRKYNLSGMQGALQMEVTNDGGFIATGQHEGNGSHGDCDIYVYKLDVCGNIDWFKIYGTGAQEGGKSIFQMNDGTFLVSGLYSGSPSNYRAFNMKIDPTGNMLWIRRYNFEWMMYSVEAANGDIISIGRNSGNLFVMRTDNTGLPIWCRQITQMGDMGLWLDELPNGDIIMSSVGAGIGKDITAARLDATGNFIWNKSYGGTGWSDQDHTTWSCKGVVDPTDNTVIVTSPTYMGGMASENILVAKLSLTDGSVLWSKAYGGAVRDQSRDITLHPGGYAVLGNTNSFSTGVNPAANINEALGEKDILLFSIATDGTLQWSRTYGGQDRDKGIGVKFNNDNGFTISAFTTSPYFGNVDASFDPLFIKTDSVGVVGCQMHSPQITEVNVALTATTVGNNQSINIAHNIPAINSVDFIPNDQYLCQACTSVPSFSLSDSMVCINDSVYLTNITVTGLTCFQQWNIDTSYFAGSTNPVVSFPAPGVYPIYLYSTCGVNSDTMMRNVYVIDPQTTVPDLICTSAASAQFAGNPPGGNWSGTNITNAGLFTPQTLAEGLYYTTYDVPEYCATTDSFLLDQPDVYAGNDTLVCVGNSIQLSANSPDPVTYTWNGNLPNNSTYTPPAVGTFSPIVQVIDTNGCIYFDTMSVDAHPIPSAGFSFVTDCYSTTVQFTSTSTVNPIYNDQLSYVWMVNNNPIPGQNATVSHDYNQSGTATMTLIVTSQTGQCLDTITQTLEVPTNPTPSFNFVQLCDYIATLTGQFPANENILEITWSINNQNVGDDSLIYNYGFPGAGSFPVTFIVTNDYPCVYSVTQNVDLVLEETLEDHTIPNVITADGDGVNDALELDVILDECLEYTMSIFNRWGHLVYQFSRYDAPFNGLDLSSKELTAGIYFYRIESGMFTKHGHITIIR